MMRIDPEIMCHVTVYKMSKVRLLESVRQIEIYVPGYTGYKNTQRVSDITLKGQAENVNAAIREITESFPCELRFLIKREHIDLVLGPNGEGNRELLMKFNVVISIDGAGSTFRNKGNGFEMRIS